MRITCLLVVCGFWFLTPASIQAQAFQQDQLVIDGEADDRARQHAIQTKKQEWSYSYSWSDSFLYVSVFLPPNPRQAQSLITGLSWWIQTDKKTSQRGFRFPIGAGLGDRPRTPEALHAALIELPDTYERFLPQSQGLELIHWPEWGDTTLADNPQEALAFAGMMEENGVLVLEGRIPWLMLRDSISQEAPQPIKFWVETGKLDRPRNLTQQDASGISGGSASNPTYTTDASMRRRWLLLDQYRDFSQAEGIKKQQLKFDPRPESTDLPKN